MRPFACLLLVVLVAVAHDPHIQAQPPVLAEAPAAASGALPARLRQPVTVTPVDGDRRLVVAARRSGSVLVVDAGERRVLAETDLGRTLADLVPLPDGRRWLAVDEASNELILAARDGAKFTVLSRLPVAANPVSVVCAPDGRKAYVASLWSRRWSVIGVGPGDALRAARVIDLDYAPRRQLLVPEKNRLILVDAFGGTLGIIDLASEKLLHVRELPAHNIRGLALSPDRKKLLIAHPLLNSKSETSNNDVHWGVLMSNVLRWLVLDRVLSPDAELLKDSHVHPPGDTRTAGGDPSGLTISGAGQAVLCLAGVDEIAYGKESDFVLERIEVGRRPTAVALSADGRTAFVVNSLADSLSFVDLAEGKVTGEAILGPRPPLTLADEGENLFYDARLALDGWFSCHTCHTDGHSTQLRADTQDDGLFGDPKRILSLLGTQGTGPWAWNGKMPSLEAQAKKSVRITMQGEALSDRAAQALSAYMQSLPPPPALPKLRGVFDADRAARGEKLFATLDCAACHRPPLYTSPDTYDVGLSDAQGQKRFNPPSLRGLSQRGPYFHDSRAETLADVFRVHRHQLSRELTPAELRDLLEFLQGL